MNFKEYDKLLNCSNEARKLADPKVLDREHTIYINNFYSKAGIRFQGPSIGGTTLYLRPDFSDMFRSGSTKEIARKIDEISIKYTKSANELELAYLKSIDDLLAQAVSEINSLI